MAPDPLVSTGTSRRSCAGPLGHCGGCPLVPAAARQPARAGSFSGTTRGGRGRTTAELTELMHARSLDHERARQRAAPHRGPHLTHGARTPGERTTPRLPRPRAQRPANWPTWCTPCPSTRARSGP
ncbi:hypothetical protein QJS66_15030 [Kocuria rhizophila]|nr:hypothetical protein QJS66_15030 [Kocuria rhizophila]